MSLRTIQLGISEVGASPCKIREENKCPNQSSELPNCHYCNYAEGDHVLFQAKHGGSTNSWSATGTKCTVGNVKEGIYFILTNKGDSKGFVSIEKVDLRKS